MKSLRSTLILSLIALSLSVGYGQTENAEYAKSEKGSFYFFWGWNRAWFTNSNLQFQGTDYDFTLNEVIADDRQSKFSFDTYFNLKKFTIPQYNFKVGYFFAENWDLSLGTDHMKYVLRQNQEVEINGFINTPESIYTGNFSNQEITLTEDFLTFEHTDGLNYINLELRHTDMLLERKKLKLRIKEGIGLGALFPKTNASLLGKERYDEFHLSGYGLNALVGINATFYNRFFIQTEIKGGYINLPDVRTTLSKEDSASHSFFFSQFNVVFGCYLGGRK